MLRTLKHIYKIVHHNFNHVHEAKNKKENKITYNLLKILGKRIRYVLM